MYSPRIAFATTCKGRVSHIEKTLPKSIADNAAYPNCVFIVVDYCDPGQLFTYLWGAHHRDIKSGKLVVYDYRNGGDSELFRMAHAKNIAHRAAILEGADILVNMDADNYTGPNFAQYIANEYSAFGPDLFMWARMIHRCNSLLIGANYCALPRNHAGACTTFDTGLDHTTAPRVRGISGRIVVSAKGFLLTGGYDERFEAWGHDDKDFSTRLQRLGYTSREINGLYLDAIHHSQKLRFQEYPHLLPAVESAWDSGQGISDPSVTIVNWGNFGTGTVYRNYKTLVELKPLPTRIFGIGLHKTATSSLNAALKMLGYDSAHWESGSWAKRIWQEMTTMGRSLTLERHYAVSDLPIPLLYMELDKAYPGSKFILTLRDEANWMQSVKNHWSHHQNRYRWEWDVYPFSNQIHKVLYGRDEFDAEVFLNRYRRHNNEVRAWFKDRPNDLLVMDMDRGAGWLELCKFLGRPVPDVPYPVYRP